MGLSFLIFSLSCHYVLQLAFADEITLTRHADGDVFTIPGSCDEACMILSSDTASPVGSASSTFSNSINDSCTCQCNYKLPIFREDLRICVDNIQECVVAAGFVSSSGLVEKVPYVFLPQYGQIIYPDAEIQFEEVKYPVCVITGVQQIGRSGWSDLRNISDVEFPLSLYRDEERTFLQWTGEAKLREAAEGKIVVVKLACRDSYPGAAHRGVFTPCVAFRVAGSPSKGSIKEVLFSTSPPNSQGLTSAEYTAIGVSSVILALIYVASVLLYLHSRKSRRKDKKVQEPESGKRSRLNDSEAPSLVKCNPLLSVSRHFESDTNSAVSEADLADKLVQSESESDIENVTSAIIHPHEDYAEQQEQNYNSGSIIAERLPEEDVRIVETIENGNYHNMSVFPGTQRRKLYFNPAYFDRQLLMAPPPAAVEFLLKIREVISIAKHKMATKRFVPTLNEIPEESSSDRQSSATKHQANRRRSNSVQNGTIPSVQNFGKKSLRCTGCPGCSHGSSTPNLPTSSSLAESAVGKAMSGESRVRAWLENVKLLDDRCRNLDDEQNMDLKLQKQQGRAKEARDADTESARMSTKSLPPIFREISQRRLNGCIYGVFEHDEHERGPQRSIKSVTHESGYLEANEAVEWSKIHAREHEEISANMSVRQAIESAFKKQSEQFHDTNLNNEPNQGRKVALFNDHLLTEEIHNMNRRNNEKTMNNDAQGIEDRKKVKNETRILLDIINSELSVRNSSDAKRIMDAVIQELVVTNEKEKEHFSTNKASDYETDSLEKAKVSRKSSSSPDYTDKSSPAQSSALPMDEELTMRNAIIDVQISETTTTKNATIIENHNLPEVVPLRPENYALVSEVYVNNGYASPTGSDDDSGPEIQYEPENPGHLTIRVVDSPNNYVQQEESEYEPDTLDRKPMKLKINDDMFCEKDIVNEVYVDSLERSSQILLRSKKSFREDNGPEMPTKPPHEYNSLREIYEARLKYQHQQEEKLRKEKQMEGKPEESRRDQSDIWIERNYESTSPLLARHQRRQRKADNQPDVVPKPPPPPPPAEIEAICTFDTKNVRDRNFTETGDPTTCKEAPVTRNNAVLVVGKPPSSVGKSHSMGPSAGKASKTDVSKKGAVNSTDSCSSRKDAREEKYHQLCKWSNNSSNENRSIGRGSKNSEKSSEAARASNLEDSAYVSSPESSNSRRQLLADQQRDERQRRGRREENSCSCTESDGSTGAANSESGAESIETDSVFFGNFRPRQPPNSSADCQKQGRALDERAQPAFNMKSRAY